MPSGDAAQLAAIVWKIPQPIVEQIAGTIKEPGPLNGWDQEEIRELQRTFALKKVDGVVGHETWSQVMLCLRHLEVLYASLQGSRKQAEGLMHDVLDLKASLETDPCRFVYSEAHDKGWVRGFIIGAITAIAVAAGGFALL